MHLGKVIGTVVATKKHESLEGIRLKVVIPLDNNNEFKGTPEIAIDIVNSSIGHIVYVVGGREASLALENSFSPVDAAIVGIVDRMDE